MHALSDNPFAAIEAKQEQLASHPVFSAIRTMEDLRRFMAWHVFAVWDFMSLVKRLQRELTTIDLPWVPAPSPLAARLINEIVLGEETDEAPGGTYLSHYELYLLAMHEVGASTAQIEHFVSLLRNGRNYADALSEVDIPPAIRDFVNHTLAVAGSGNLNQVLGSFFFGRESVIPKMFRSLLASWQIAEKQAPSFVYYLNRHIELDSDAHGPAAWRIIGEMTKDDPAAIAQLQASANAAIDARFRLWDGLALELGKTR